MAQRDNKTRTIDAHFKNKLESDTVYTCEPVLQKKILRSVNI